MYSFWIFAVHQSYFLVGMYKVQTETYLYSFHKLFKCVLSDFCWGDAGRCRWYWVSAPVTVFGRLRPIEEAQQFTPVRLQGRHRPKCFREGKTDLLNDLSFAWFVLDLSALLFLSTERPSFVFSLVCCLCQRLWVLETPMFVEWFDTTP